MRTVAAVAFLFGILAYAQSAMADQCLVTNQSCGTDPCYPSASPIGIHANCTFNGPNGQVYATDQFGFPWDCSCPSGFVCGYVAGDGAGGQCCQSTVTCPANSCGYVPDGCVGMGIYCGGCSPGQTCVGNSCCTPRTSCPVGACSVISDGCGGTLSCGTCTAPQTCVFDNTAGYTTCQAPPRVPAAPWPALAAMLLALVGTGGWLVTRRRT